LHSNQKIVSGHFILWRLDSSNHSYVNIDGKLDYLITLERTDNNNSSHDQNQGTVFTI